MYLHLFKGIRIAISNFGSDTVDGCYFHIVLGEVAGCYPRNLYNDYHLGIIRGILRHFLL